LFYEQLLRDMSHNPHDVVFWRIRKKRVKYQEIAGELCLLANAGGDFGNRLRHQDLCYPRQSGGILFSAQTFPSMQPRRMRTGKDAARRRKSLVIACRFAALITEPAASCIDSRTAYGRVYLIFKELRLGSAELDLCSLSSKAFLDADHYLLWQQESFLSFRGHCNKSPFCHFGGIAKARKNPMTHLYTDVLVVLC